MKQAVIVFQKTPELGKVKTRLASSIGDEEAMRVYVFLVEYTHQLLKEVKADIHVFIDGKISPDSAAPAHYFFHAQQGSDLGARMRAAFNHVFSLGYQQVVIIGTDCYEISAKLITHSFILLAETDLVVGPAKDGGYYLLGMSKPTPELFAAIPWSTSSVCQDTLSRAEGLGLTASLLPVLRDIDTADDLGELAERLNIRNKPISPPPKTPNPLRK